MKLELKYSDGTILNFETKRPLIYDASGVFYDDTYFLFRNFNDGILKFEEGNIVFLFDDELINPNAKENVKSAD